MARAMIGYEIERNKIQFVYCEMVSFPLQTLQILEENYDLEKVKELVAKGTLFELKENIEDIEFWGCGMNGDVIAKPRYLKMMVATGCKYCYYLGRDGKWYFQK